MTAPAFDMALDLLGKSKDPVADIVRSSAYWIPLQFVYGQMVLEKSITPWSFLPKERRMQHWRMTDRDWEQWKRISVCLAIYVYEELTE